MKATNGEGGVYLGPSVFRVSFCMSVVARVVSIGELRHAYVDYVVPSRGLKFVGVSWYGVVGS